MVGMSLMIRRPLVGSLVLAVSGCVLSVDGCASHDRQPELAGPLAALTIVGGDRQAGPVAQELPQPLAVRATDAAGKVLPGITVSFSVSSGGGEVFVGTTTTGANGEARDRWTLGASVNAEQTVQARAIDPSTGAAFTAVFSATAVAGAPRTVTVVGGDAQRGPAGARLPIPLAVRLADASGNPVAGAALTFTVIAGGGSLSVSQASTDSVGIGYTSWTIGGSGPQEVRAAIASGLSASFTATVGGADLRWRALAPMPLAVRGVPATATDGSRIYVMGGYASGVMASNQIYDPTTDTWSQGAQTPEPTNYAMAAATALGIHLMGGEGTRGELSSHRVYHPDTDTWSVLADIPIAIDAAATWVHEGRIYLIGGGLGGAAVSSAVYMYDPALNRWSTRAPMPTARFSPGIAWYEGELVLSGGWAGGDGLTTVEAYNPATNTWRALTALPIPRETHASGVIDGRLCVTVGRRQRRATLYSTTSCLAEDGRSWQAETDAPRAVDEVGYVQLNGHVYVLGGGTNSLSSALYRLEAAN